MVFGSSKIEFELQSYVLYLAYLFTGEIYAWGMGTSNQLGQADDDDFWEPVQMTGKQLEAR